MLDNVSITKKERDCLVTLGKHRDSKFPFRLIDLSKNMEIKPPTALNLIKRLEKKESCDQRERNDKAYQHWRSEIYGTGRDAQGFRDPYGKIWVGC